MLSAIRFSPVSDLGQARGIGRPAKFWGGRLSVRFGASASVLLVGWYLLPEQLLAFYEVKLARFML